MEGINRKSIKRANKAIRCLPFNSEFYKSAQVSGLSAENVFQKKGKYLSNKSSWFKDSEEIENDFRWLIVIGVLRREVDGQGLTSRVRLTPLGRYIIEKTPEILEEKVLIVEKIGNFIYRKIIFN
tara:strand:- start:1958 stop:2332 length:375 start_codon:yes stop_codon:yes gene_type:complete